MSKVNLIVAMNHDNVIGVNNQLPWHIPEDLAYFKQITTGCPIIMGRKTLLSIGRILPNRRNLVITRDRDFTYPGAEIYHSIDESISSCSEDQVFVIGGGDIFTQALSIADKLYITYLDVAIDNPEVFFPIFDVSEFRLISENRIISNSGVKCNFCIFERIN